LSGAISLAISARCRFIASVLQLGRTSAAPLPSFGQMAPKGGTLVTWRRWARSAPRPSPGDLVLLTDPRLVGEPDFYCGRIDALILGDLIQARRETFLKSSIAPSACA